MAHLLIFTHNSGIWKGTIHSQLKNSTHFSCYHSLSKGCNVQISKCLTLIWDAMSRNGQWQDWWPECVQPPSPPGNLAAQLKSPYCHSCFQSSWMFLQFSEALDVYSNRNFVHNHETCTQSRPIKSKGQNIKCRCYHVGNFSTIASALYRKNSTCISSQEVKLQVKLPVEKKTSSDCRHR